MAKKSRKTNRNFDQSVDENVLSKQKQLDDLNKQKIELLKNLVQIENTYNSLVNPKIKTAEDWLYGLPIESLNPLSHNCKLRTRLGDARTRASLKKSSVKALDEIEKIDRQIKNAHIDLVGEQINSTLSRLKIGP